MLTLTNKEVGDIVVVNAAGRITLGKESNNLKGYIRGFLNSGKKGVVLNVQGITYVDHAGLGTLVACHSDAKNRKQGFVLCCINRKFEEVLHVTKLDAVFVAFDTEEEAVASFSK